MLLTVRMVVACLYEHKTLWQDVTQVFRDDNDFRYLQTTTAECLRNNHRSVLGGAWPKSILNSMSYPFLILAIFPLLYEEMLRHCSVVCFNFWIFEHISLSSLMLDEQFKASEENSEAQQFLGRNRCWSLNVLEAS